LAFAQIASTADQETVAKLVNLLTGLRDSLQASLDQDSVDETESATAFETLISNLTGNLDSANHDLTATRK
jgi:hypothetical protein